MYSTMRKDYNLSVPCIFYVVHIQGHVSKQRPFFPGIAIPMLKIKRSRDRLIFNMGIHIQVRRHLDIETAPRQLLDICPSDTTSLYYNGDILYIRIPYMFESVE